MAGSHWGSFWEVLYLSRTLTVSKVRGHRLSLPSPNQLRHSAGPFPWTAGGGGGGGLPFPTGKVHDWSRQALRPFAGYAFSDARDLTALRRGTPRQIKGTRLTPNSSCSNKVRIFSPCPQSLWYWWGVRGEVSLPAVLLVTWSQNILFLSRF